MNNPDVISVTGVTLDQRSITLPEGGTSTLKATVMPGNAVNKNVTWSSSNVNKATVLGGVVTALTAGTAIITVTTEDGGHTATCAVTVTPAPVSIEVANPPDKTVYKTGGNLDLTGLVVKATYGDGSHGEIDIYTFYISGFDSSTAGEKTITVTYGGKSDTFTVTVLALAKIEVTKFPDIVAIGEPLNIEALEVQATWGDDRTDKYIKERVEITLAHISGFDVDEAKIQTVTVTYEGKTATFDVLVLGIAELIIASEPNKTLYKHGEELNIAGLVVRAIFSNGEEREVEHSALGVRFPGNRYDAGEKIIDVYYGVNGHATFTVTVLAFAKIEVVKSPDIVDFGEQLEFEDIEVEATWGDDSTDKYIKERVPPSGISGFDEYKVENQTVTVICYVNNDIKTATFNVLVFGVTKIEITSLPTKTRYVTGESFDPTGLIVTATYSDNSTETVTPSSIGFYSYNVGIQTVTVTYNYYNFIQATFTVTVLATVTFNPNAGAWGSETANRTVLVEGNTEVAEPEEPSRSRRSFIGWYTQATGGVAYNFSTPVTGNITLYAWWDFTLPLTDTDDIVPYLNTQTGTQTNPAALPMQIDLGTMASSTSGWRQLLTALNTAGKYVDLDLSACTMSGTEFNPDTSTANGKYHIVSVTLPDTATSIPSGTSNSAAFRYFSDLETVNGKGITSVGAYAFYNCSSLASVSLPLAETIGIYAFYGCRALTDVSLPSAETIGNYAFYACRAMADVSLPSAETIGSSAFYGCTSLASVSLPSATFIGNSAFEGCTLLESVSLSAMKTIGNNVLSGLTSLKSVSLPLVETIGERAFRGCKSLESISLPAVKTIDNSAYYAGGSSAFEGCTSLASVSLPSATLIGNYAFGGCTSLASVILPSAETIGNYAFSGTSLASVSLPGAETIGFLAFQDCNSLTSVSLPIAKTIGEGAFFGCTSLESVSMPGAETIGEGAFAACTSLANVEIPSVRFLGKAVFSNTGTRVLSIRMGETAPEVRIDIFGEVTATKNVTVRVPPHATGYGTSPINTTSNNWGNAFRSVYFDGLTFYPNGTVNANINLIIQYMTE